MKHLGILFLLLIMLSACGESKNEADNSASKQREEQLNNLKYELDRINLWLEEVRALRSNFQTSYLLIQKWVNQPSREDDPEKQQLNKLINDEVPASLEKLSEYATNWNEQQNSILAELKGKTDFLFNLYHRIQHELNSFESYEDAAKLLMCKMVIDEDGDIDLAAQKLDFQCQKLVEIFKFQSNELNQNMDQLILEMKQK